MRQESLIEEASRVISRAEALLIGAGAGTAIPTIRLKCQEIARDHHGSLIRVNPNEPDGPPGTISLPLGAQEALHQVDSLIR